MNVNDNPINRIFASLHDAARASRTFTPQDRARGYRMEEQALKSAYFFMWGVRRNLTPQEIQNGGVWS